MTDPNALLHRNHQPEDHVEYSLRPESLDSFIGQEQSKQNLRIFMEAAKKRGDMLDHVLLYGPPGLGKTTMAHIVAKEMGVNFRSTSGPMLTKPGDLAALLTNLERHDVLFIDEIHRLHTSIEEILYPAMEDFMLDFMIGEGPSARSVRIDLQPFTLVGATTRLGLLSNPLRDRFGIPIRMQFYQPDELCKVIHRASELLNITCSEDGAAEIAHRARGTPRIALRLLKRVRDVAIVEDSNIITQNIADKALHMLEVDSAGLDSNDHRYLRMIAEHHGGGPVGVETIAAALSEQRDAIEETIEPYLIQIGFLQRTPRGRLLTKTAFDHLGLASPTHNSSDMDLFNISGN